MARSSFSKGLSASVFLGAIALACLSAAYFRHKWRGLIVSNAGDAAAVSTVSNISPLSPSLFFKVVGACLSGPPVKAERFPNYTFAC